MLRNKKTKTNLSKGYTIIELVIGIGIFAVIATAFISSYLALSRSVKTARERTEVSTLSANYLEIVRNLPYSQIGTINGNPSGMLPDFANAQSLTLEGRVYAAYYEVTYIDDAADGTILAGTDVAANDYKQVKLNIRNPEGKVFSFITNISPQGLEGTTGAGALLIRVINAQGQPVPSASVVITNASSSPTLSLNRTTDSNGQWAEVGLTPSPSATSTPPANSYRIVVTKTGYSTDQTYPITAQNPNPIKPHATILSGQVTQITFTIDLLSNLNIRTLNQNCQPLNGVNVNVKGAKLIGTNPNVLKFDNNYSSSSGVVALANIEWDTYFPTLLAGQDLVVYGTNPIQQISVLPGTTQTFTLILGTGTTNSLLVIVKDASTGVALENATVHLRKGGSQPQDYYAITGGSVWVQSDWTGGSGQAAWLATDRYFVDDGNIDINSAPTGVRLKKVTGDYVASGYLESSTFDTGSSSDFTTLTWEPTSQDPAATLKFQIASNNDNATWNYKGPDGTAGTYYTVSGTTISSAHDGTRYVRYKAYLSTTNDKRTPVLTSAHINYVSGCYTPGQSMFPDLTSGNNYDLDVSLTGYDTQIINNLNVSGNQVIEVLMAP